MSRGYLFASFLALFLHRRANGVRIDIGIRVVRLIELLAALPTYDADQSVKTTWDRLRDGLSGTTGVCYYKSPIVQTQNGAFSDLIVISRDYQPIVVRCIAYQISEIDEITSDTWLANGNEIDSPVLEIEDLQVALTAKLSKDRTLRGRMVPMGLISMPLIRQTDFIEKFGESLDTEHVLWSQQETSSITTKLPESISDLEWRHARSVLQGASALKSGITSAPRIVPTLGEAVKVLDRQIALLDDEQEKVALQIAPGPQRIRGLAGTGKTVLLAMKAANAHLHFPDQMILFTFSNRSGGPVISFGRVLVGRQQPAFARRMTANPVDLPDDQPVVLVNVLTVSLVLDLLVHQIGVPPERLPLLILSRSITNRRR